MANLLIIRHGQASFGADNYDQLSPLGQRQADLTGEFLRQMGTRFSAAYSGDLSRQRETGQRVLDQLEDAPDLVIDPRFNEVQTDEQIDVMMPILIERDPRFADLVTAMNTDTKSFQKIIETVFNYWVSPECDIGGIQSWADYSGGVVSAFNWASKSGNIVWRSWGVGWRRCAHAASASRSTIRSSPKAVCRLRAIASRRPAEGGCRV